MLEDIIQIDLTSRSIGSYEPLQNISVHLYRTLLAFDIFYNII